MILYSKMMILAEMVVVKFIQVGIPEVVLTVVFMQIATKSVMVAVVVTAIVVGMTTMVNPSHFSH